VKQGAFFREPAHFELLARTVLPGLARARNRRTLQLWSAGCSSGEEAWSIAMIVEEARVPPHVAVTILATDRDPRAVARASDGVYREDEMHRVSPERRRRHFVGGVGPRKGLWRVVAPLRDRVEFVELDLIGPWPERGAFDIVVCHDAITRLDGRSAERLVRRFADVLGPGGVMLLGSWRSLTDELPRLEPYGRAAYRKIA
jgi:chemotaxis protein methyltransferase CheR